MHDPWDVKCVRQSGQYVSCMKINGVPLLPPVLSKECRKEMQYYKLLAKEVENRISSLKLFSVCDSDSSEDKTDAPELPENEECYELLQEEIKAGFDVNIEKITAITKETYRRSQTSSPKPYNATDYYKSIKNVNPPTTPTLTCSPKLVIDLNLSINEAGRNVLETVNSPRNTSPTTDLPERDYNCKKKLPQKELITEVESAHKNKKQNGFENTVNFSFSVNKELLSHPFTEMSEKSDGPSSLSSKSFTGSLIDIHTESLKESQMAPKLIRQRSYTLLKPGPQLQAHLDVQSMSTGVDVKCISMSESLSNLSSPNKKRRSWDLETAKEKWSSMALELKQKTVKSTPKVNGACKNNVSKLPSQKVLQPSPVKSKSLSTEKPRKPNALIPKTVPKSEPIPKAKRPISPVRSTASNRTVTKEPTPPKESTPKVEPSSQNPPALISESEDPAARVRELYEKIQKQQLIQMANLVEKQKKEQLLLQQVFEEQNNLLYKQLKTICPTSPVEVKKAWGDTDENCPERGPVSLSELINQKTPEKCDIESPVSVTLTETNNYISHCDDVLKRSKDLKKQLPNTRVVPQNGARASPRNKMENNNRTSSPMSRNTSRRLNYDTSASSDRDYEPILTDRTNDTMADLNVTFPTDLSDHSHSSNKSLVPKVKELSGGSSKPMPSPASSCKTPAQIISMSESLQASINSLIRQPVKTQVHQPTPQERVAATRIVAYARGYLVRRLMRTERVQTIVQTIRDALLCALQLHRDRAGITGPDVDLHRRLIQQITAACYTLHDTFITSTPAERCAMIAADRGRRRSLAARPPPPARPHRPKDVMSQSHSGVFSSRPRRPSASSLMTQSNYETFSMEKSVGSGRRYPASPRRRPWR